MPDQNSWMGPRGFDEAKYYRDEKHEIGIAVPDDQIRSHSIEAISRNPKLDRFEIEVKVRNGVITLVGEVDSSSDRDETEKTIRNLAGVKSVINLLSLH